jgi:hypothetical protein
MQRGRSLPYGDSAPEAARMAANEENPHAGIEASVEMWTSPI